MRTSFVGVAAFIGALLSTTMGGAQTHPVPRPSRIEPPARTLASTDDSDALALSPAQLAFAPSWDLRYTHVELPNASTTIAPGLGDSLGFALPLWFGFATGMRIENVRPPAGAANTMGSDSTALTWALAYKPMESFAVGLDVRRWWSGEPQLDGAASVGLSAAYRPWNWLGLSLVGRDLNSPEGKGPFAIVPSMVAGLVVRPTGTRTIEIGLESAFWKHGPPATGWSPRASLALDVPYVGRAVADFRIVDPAGSNLATNWKNSWIVTAGLELGWRHGRLGGGLLGGPGLAPGSNGLSTPGFYASASIAGFKEPGLPDFERAVTIRIEETPGVRGHVKLLRKLARLRRDPTVRAVTLALKSEAANSMAHAEELADALQKLRDAGIKVLCHMEDAGGRTLLACSPANKIYVIPVGALRLAGLRTQTMYFGEALAKLGVEPDIVRIKEHKSAPEAYMRSGPTPVAVADHKEYLETIEKVFLERVAPGRKLSPAALKAAIAKGPFLSEEAVAAGLIDGKVFDDELPKKIREEVGRSIRIEEDSAETLAPAAFNKAARIAIIYLDGDIVDGRSESIPIIGIKTAGGRTMAETIDAARNDPTIKGVVLRIESPGGASIASDMMWRSLELLAHQKPVVVSMGSIAASGGYYSAAFGAPIWANRSTLTGSIGIFWGKADVSGLLAKLGVRVVTEKTAPKADGESLYRGFTDEERVELMDKTEKLYATFLDRVSRGRKLPVADIDAVGRGKVWLGVQAIDKKLVDHLGGIDDALADLRKQLDMADDAPIVELPKESGGLLDFVVEAVGLSTPAAPAIALPKQLLPFAQALAPFLIYRPDEPLALYDGIDVP